MLAVGLLLEDALPERVLARTGGSVPRSDSRRDGPATSAAVRVANHRQLKDLAMHELPTLPFANQPALQVSAQRRAVPQPRRLQPLGQAAIHGFQGQPLAGRQALDPVAVPRPIVLQFLQLPGRRCLWLASGPQERSDTTRPALVNFTHGG